MKKKAIFFDIDGTIFDIKTGVPESTQRAIRKLKEKGHLCFVNSGRSRANITKLYNEMGFDGFVAGCGAYIEAEGRIHKNVLLTEAELKKATDIFRAAKADIIYEGYEKIYYDPLIKDKIYDTLAQYFGAWAIENFVPFEENGEHRVNKLYCDLYPDSDIGLLEKELSEDFELIIHYPPECAELIPKGLSKATGIYDILRLYDMEIEDTIAFGDSANDLEMIKAAGLGIAMGNSLDILKQAADFCTKGINDDGIEYALKHFELI